MDNMAGKIHFCLFNVKKNKIKKKKKKKNLKAQVGDFPAFYISLFRETHSKTF